MRIDLNEYRINSKYIKDLWKKDWDKYPNISTVISVVAPSTCCPCLALAFYLAEDVGFTEELVHMIDMLIKFYGYTDIRGQTIPSPYMTEDGKCINIQERVRCQK